MKDRSIMLAYFSQQFYGVDAKIFLHIVTHHKYDYLTIEAVKAQRNTEFYISTLNLSYITQSHLEHETKLKALLIRFVKEVAHFPTFSSLPILLSIIPPDSLLALRIICPQKTQLSRNLPSATRSETIHLINSHI